MKKKGTHTRGGFAPPDHPLYGLGPVVAGIPIERRTKPRVIVGGALPPDHPIFSRGVMIFGRPDPPKK